MCRNLHGLLLRQVINSFPPGIIAAQHFFSVFIQLKIVNDQFVMTNVRSNLLGRPTETITKSSRSMKNPTIAFLSDLLDDYKRYKYVYVPVTLNYGRDPAMNHQACFMFDMESNECMIYEPYGTYNKYGYDYHTAFGLVPKQLGFSVVTWHDKMGLTHGLQTILINRAHTLADEFNHRLSQFNPPKPNKMQLERREFDPTVESMSLVTRLEHQTPRNIDELKAAYLLFNTYTCKSCVTLSLVELMLTRPSVHQTQKNVHVFYERVRQNMYPSFFINNHFMRAIHDIVPFEIHIERPLSVECDRLTGKSNVNAH